MYTVKLSPSGVAHVCCDTLIFCSVHHTHAGGIQEAMERAIKIAELLNKEVA